MADLSFPADQGISPIAVSEPFELFSKDAVRLMRDEVLSDEVWDNCRFSSNIAACQLRGMAPKYVFCFSFYPFCLGGYECVWISLGLIYIPPAAHGHL